MSKSDELLSRVQIRRVRICFISEGGEQKTGIKENKLIKEKVTTNTQWEVLGVECAAQAIDTICYIHRNGGKTLELISFEAAAVKGFCLSQESNPSRLMNICPR